jgi:hypothetical protein
MMMKISFSVDTIFFGKNSENRWRNSQRLAVSLSADWSAARVLRSSNMWLADNLLQKTAKTARRALRLAGFV